MAGKPGLLRYGVNKLGKLRRGLSRISARLIHLARCRLNVQNGFILDGLLNRRRDDTGMSGANCVHSHIFATTIAMDDLLQSLACVFGLRVHSWRCYSGWASRSRCLLKSAEIVAFGP